MRSLNICGSYLMNYKFSDFSILYLGWSCYKRPTSLFDLFESFELKMYFESKRIWMKMIYNTTVIQELKNCNSQSLTNFENELLGGGQISIQNHFCACNLRNKIDTHTLKTIWRPTMRLIEWGTNMRIWAQLRKMVIFDENYWGNSISSITLSESFDSFDRRWSPIHKNESNINPNKASDFIVLIQRPGLSLNIFKYIIWICI